MEDEIWKYIPGFPDYAVSSHGRVSSLRYNRLIRDRRGTDGARRVALYKGLRRYDMYVHQLMAMAFVIAHEQGDPVGHINGFREDNYLDNLLLHTYNFGFDLRADLEYDGVYWHRLW